jgi:uncharacterized protein (TIGR02677 family)
VAETRPWRVVDPDLFRFTTTDLAPLHLAVMAAFEQSAVLAPALNVDQVRAALARTGWDEPTDDGSLHQVLEALTRWRLLEATQDHSARYATPEEFERKNLQWSLTPRGEAAVGGVLHAVDALRHAVGLQTAVLDAIGDDLGVLADLAAQPRSAEADARIHIQLSQIERHLTALVNGVRQFNGHLQRLLREDATDDEVFADVKRRTVTYLEEYVTGVERPQRRLAAAIGRVESVGLATVFDRALSGANLAPVADNDPAPAWLADREKRWRALRAWFVGEGASPAQIAGLLDIARTAIVELLRVLERRWDSRRRSASIAHDFRALARWFAAAPGEEEAHRLFAAAFGLWPARHAHLRAVDGQERAPTSPWTETEPVEVAPALRTTGSLSNRGRTSPVADPSQVRAARQRAQAEALAAHDAVQEALTTRGSVRLSTFGRLPAAEFAELLSLLAAGLEAPAGGDGARRALSADGRVEVVLSDPGDGASARLATEEGVLHGPDLVVSISLVGEAYPIGVARPVGVDGAERVGTESAVLEAAGG